MFWCKIFAEVKYFYEKEITKILIIFDILSIKVCLVGWILGKIKKRGEKMGGENIFCECLVEGRGGKKTDGPGCFLIGPTKMFSLHIGEKTRENKNGQTWQNGPKFVDRLKPTCFDLARTHPLYLELKTGQLADHLFLVAQPNQLVEPFLNSFIYLFIFYKYLDYIPRY